MLAAGGVCVSIGAISQHDLLERRWSRDELCRLSGEEFAAIAESRGFCPVYSRGYPYMMYGRVAEYVPGDEAQPVSRDKVYHGLLMEHEYPIARILVIARARGINCEGKNRRELCRAIVDEQYAHYGDPAEEARARLDLALADLPDPVRKAGVEPVGKRAFYERLLDALANWDTARATLRGWERTGASDAQIREWLGYQWGLGGGSSGPGLIGEHHIGGDNPRFGVGGSGYLPERANAHLRGLPLFTAVRVLFRISKPGEAQVVQKLVQGSLLEMCA